MNNNALDLAKETYINVQAEFMRIRRIKSIRNCSLLAMTINGFAIIIVPLKLILIVGVLCLCVCAATFIGEQRSRVRLCQLRQSVEKNAVTSNEFQDMVRSGLVSSPLRNILLNEK